MSSPKIAVVIPTIRPEQHKKFVEAWTPLFEKHKVTLVTIWDGEKPRVREQRFFTNNGFSCRAENDVENIYKETHRDLFCRFTDACRNIGFVYAAHLGADYILTLDDDVVPMERVTGDVGGNNWETSTNDPIQEHLDVLDKRVPISWMNTAMGDLYLRGVPYGIRNEAPVMLSHGVWIGVPDFDGETQLRLEGVPLGDSKEVINLDTRLPYTLPYYKGPIPKHVLFPLCGMNVMIRKEALPYFYFAPMGPDTRIYNTEYIGKQPVYKGQTITASDVEVKRTPSLNRFADIWMGVFLKREFDRLGWACYTGGSTVLHTRASDARKNMEQEKLGREWNEVFGRVGNNVENVCGLPDTPPGFFEYMKSYSNKRQRYADLIRSIHGGNK